MGCPFCNYADRTLIIHDDARTIVVPSRQQRAGSLGHCIVAPRVHVETLYALDDATAAALLPVVRDAAIAVKQAFGADGVAIRQNNEAAGPGRRAPARARDPAVRERRRDAVRRGRRGRAPGPGAGATCRVAGSPA